MQIYLLLGKKPVLCDNKAVLGVWMKITIFTAAIILAGFFFAFAQTWTQTSAPTNLTWNSIACSADGKNLMAFGVLFHGNTIYTSTNYGVNWISNSPPDSHSAFVTCSANGNRMFAAFPFGKIFVSTNYGNTWQTTSAPTNNWWTIATSADGSKLVSAVGSGGGNFKGFIYTTSDGGLNWATNNALSNDWIFATSSADGNKLAVAPYFGSLFLSTNSGNTWTTNPATSQFYWRCLACSADGNKLTAVASLTNFNYSIYTSSNSGQAWISNSLPVLNLQSVACSTDGNNIVAIGQSSSAIYVSTNQGVTWVTNNVPSKVWYCVCSSADGKRLVAGTADYGNSGLFNSLLNPNPLLQVAKTDGYQISWTIPSTNFVLQQSSDLSNWSAVTNVPVLNLTNLQNQVTLPLSAGSSFFRLATP
jgi:photosystem II stability/assembly factor-like uncharacterized protein